jgi:AmmeMemoRadiSam system protein A
MKESVVGKEGLALLRLARACIAGKFKGKDIKDIEAQIFNGISKDFLEKKRGVFVTLHKKGRLRGCIGNIEPVKTLVQGVRENAVSAAFKDSRFSPLALDELNQIDIEISILTQPEQLAYKGAKELLSSLAPGIDGVILEKDHHRATFLPQVWDQLPEPEEFLAQLCMKAGLSSSEWEKSGLKVYTYQVQSFGELDRESDFKA